MDESNPTFDASLGLGLTTLRTQQSKVESKRPSGQSYAQDFEFATADLKTPAKRRHYPEIFDDEALHSIEKIDLEAEGCSQYQQLVGDTDQSQETELIRAYGHDDATLSHVD